MLVEYARGVTLTELLVAIIIIAILSVVVTTNLSTATEGAEEAQLQDIAGKVSSALQMALIRRPAGDPTRWEGFLQPGDFELVMEHYASFFYLAPGDTFAAGVRGPYHGHPSDGGGERPNTTNLGGLPLPEKLYLQSDPKYREWSSTPPNGLVVCDGVPYVPEP